jgi:hypothetical protein
MPASKKLTDLVDYTAILPMQANYLAFNQPLLGWKSKRSEKRFEKGLDLDKQSFLTILTEQFSSKVKSGIFPGLRRRD